MEIIDALDAFCDYSRYVRGYAIDTITRYRATVRLLVQHSHATTLVDCTNLKVRQFLYHGRQALGWAPNSYITYHQSLVVFFRWCVAQGYLQANPTDGIEMPKVARTLPPKLTQQEALRLLEVAQSYPYVHPFQRTRNHAIIATFIFAGLRKRELLRLRTDDLDVPNATIFVRQGKGSKDRIVPLSATLSIILRRYADHRLRLHRTCPEFFTALAQDRGFSETGLKRLIGLLQRESGIHFGAHKLRHTFATLMLEGGCDIFSLSKLMGHSDIKTTTIYLAASPAFLRSQILKHPLSNVERMRWANTE